MFEKSEQTGRFPEIVNDTIGLVEGVFVAGFLVGAVAQTNQTNEHFKRNNQLTVYVDKRAASVNCVRNLKLEIKSKTNRFWFLLLL